MAVRLRDDFSDEGEISDHEDMPVEPVMEKQSGNNESGRVWSAMIQAEDLEATLKTMPINDSASKLKMVERDTESFPAPLPNDFKLPKLKNKKSKVCFLGLLKTFDCFYEVLKFLSITHQNYIFKRV